MMSVCPVLSVMSVCLVLSVMSVCPVFSGRAGRDVECAEESQRHHAPSHA